MKDHTQTTVVSKVLRIHPKDNVFVALTDLAAGEAVSSGVQEFRIAEPIPAKHKFVEQTVEAGEEIFMYGVLIGKATQRIEAGCAIGTHNLKHEASAYGGRQHNYQWTAPNTSKWKNKTFMGYHRSDGQVGTANYWLVVPMVFCENRNVDVIRDAFEKELGYSAPNAFQEYVRSLITAHRQGRKYAADFVVADKTGSSKSNRVFQNIDGIRFLKHEGGCGGTRQDAEALCSLLAGYINNPNVAGATVLSLGCQHAQVDLLLDKLKKHNAKFNKPLVILEQQKEGTEQALLLKAISQTFEAMAKANEQQREPAPLSKLVVGLECGGSDGFSGISANPAIGYTSDLVVALGGATMLSEFPELCGVEQELINRCVSAEAATKFMKLMQAYSKAAEAVGSGFDMNPSPGNIKDGLITDAMKSAGAAKKGGTAPVSDVLDYGEYIQRPGLNLLCTPGNDVESTTAMAGSGANIILFTTGLGTPTGNPVTPVIKLSSNTRLAVRMPDIIDINTGDIIEGKKSIEQMGEETLDFVIEVASGNIQPKAVALQQHDFIPWKRGVSL